MAQARECYGTSAVWVVLRIMVIKGHKGYKGVYRNIWGYIYTHIYIYKIDK